MAMGTRKSRERQEPLWYGTELPVAPGHPFYNRLNEALDKAGFDRHCEESCAGFYHAKLGRPSLAPGLYFRIMMIGFFEGLDSERGIAWRVADSLTLRQFLSIGLNENTPDHVTISRTRRLLDGETHQHIFNWVLERLAQSGLIKGKSIGVDSNPRTGETITICRDFRAAAGSDQRPRRSVAARWPPSRALRRFHRSRRRAPSSRGRQAVVDDHGPALWSRLRSALAGAGRSRQTASDAAPRASLR